MAKTKKRILLLDKLRGVAVFLMILAHSIVFFNFGSDPVLDYISKLGDTVAFTTFLFVSGAVSYLAYIDTRKHDVTLRRKAFSRFLSLLIGFYLISIAVSLRSLIYSDFNTIATKVVKIILFIDLPSYSEFLVPFLVFGPTTIIFQDKLRALLNNKLLVILVAAVLYLIGAILYKLSVPLEFAYIKSLFVGHDDWYRFPILQYSPVYLVGMLWMKLVSDSKMKSSIKYSSIFLYFSLLLLVVGLVINNFTGIYEFSNLLNRWPPTPYFILTGMIFVLLASIIIEITKKFSVIAVLQWGFNLMGRKAFLYYIIHIILLFAYRYTLNEKIETPIFVLGLFIALLTLTAIIVKLSDFFWGSNKREAREHRRFFGKHKLELFLLFFVVFLSGSFLYLYDGQKIVDDTDPIRQTDVIDDSVPYWWDDTYKANRQITVQATSTGLKENDVISFSIDHARLVAEGKSREDALDMKLLSFEFGEFEEIEFNAVDLNTDSTQIFYKLKRDIEPNRADGRYYLYYGNEGTFLGYVPDTVLDVTNKSYQIVFGEELIANLKVDLTQKWLLKGKGVEQDAKKGSFNIEVNNIDLSENKLMTKLVSESNTLTLDTTQVESGKFNVDLNGDNLEAGTYTIQAFVEDTNYISSINTFYVSYPLYVTWTMDWEGFDTADQYLNSMSAISRDHNIPITQFFNPRIFIAKDISEARRQRLVNWILEREKNNGDEIALHLHMHYDLIEAVGLVTRTSPRWGGRTNGHDVLTSAYPYSEFYQIVQWSKGKFSEYGLPEPIAYRAGGWFLDLENIRVLEDLGFLIDSSGREYYIWGPNQQEGLWNLQSTSKPYQPSKVNQNANEPEPVFNIWEFPNNGVDSTNRSAQEMISRFDDNYQGQPLTEPQVVTFLSHPHWFDIFDSPKLRELFTHTDQFKFSADNGPIIYTTLEGAYPTWSDN